MLAEGSAVVVGAAVVVVGVTVVVVGITVVVVGAAVVVVGARVVVVGAAVVVVGARVVVISTVSEVPPQEVASKRKQATASNFLTPTSLPYSCGGGARRMLLHVDTPSQLCKISYGFCWRGT